MCVHACTHASMRVRACMRVLFLGGSFQCVEGGKKLSPMDVCSDSGLTQFKTTLKE